MPLSITKFWQTATLSLQHSRINSARPSQPYLVEHLAQSLIATLLLTIRGKCVFFLLVFSGSAFMTEKPSDLVQGTLDMLILKTLALEPMHGYGIAVRLEQMSKGVFRLNAGSLFVAFQRLQRAGLVRSEWKATEKIAGAQNITS